MASSIPFVIAYVGFVISISIFVLCAVCERIAFQLERQANIGMQNLDQVILMRKSIEEAKSYVKS